MRSVLSTLACLLLCALPACAITEEEIIQAVRDFDNDPNLSVQSVATEPTQLRQGESASVPAYLVVVGVNAGSGALSRIYFIAESPSLHVVTATYPDRSSQDNPAAPNNPVTAEQAEAIARSFALAHHPVHSQIMWHTATGDGLSGGTTFYFYRVLSNGAETDVGGCSVEVCLDTGLVVGYYQDEGTLQTGADQPPALGLEDAKARAAQELDLGQRTMQGKLIVNGDGRLVYRLLPDYTQDEMATSEDALPTDIEIDANTGALVSKDYWKGSAAPRESPGLASYVPVMLAALAIIGLLLFFRKRARR